MRWETTTSSSIQDRLTGQSHVRRRKARGPTVLAALALGLAGCSSNNADDSAVDDSVDASGADAAEETSPSIAAVLPDDSTADSTSGDTSTADQSPVSLRVATWDKNQTATQQKYIDAFEAEHPNVTIELETIPFGEYVQTLQTAQTGGAGYDIIWMNAPNLPTFVSNEILLPLDDYVAADDFDLSVFPEGLVDMYTVDDRLYAISKDFDTIGLFYNKAAFADAGVDEPTEDWTWDDLRSAATALTTETQKGFAAIPYEQELVFPLIFSAGGDPLNADRSATDLASPKACSALEFIASFHADGTSPDIATLDTTWYVDDFVTGKTAMITTGSWDTKNIVDQMGDNVGLVGIPAGERDANLIHGLGWAIMATSQHPDTAWEFVKAISTKQAHELQAEDGVAIPSYEGTAKIWTDSFPTLDATVFIDAAATADPFPVANADGGWTGELYTSLGDQLNTDPTSPELCSAVNDATNTYIADHPAG